METDDTFKHNSAFINLVWEKYNQNNASKDLFVCQCISGTETIVSAER